MKDWLTQITHSSGDVLDQIQRLGEMYAEAARTDKTREAWFRSLLEHLGVPPEMIRQMAANLGEWKKGLADVEVIYRDLGFSAKTAAEQGVAAARELNKTWLEAGTIWDSVIIELFPIFRDVLKSVNDVVKEHMGDLRGFFAEIGAAIKDLNKPENWRQFKEDLNSIASGAKDLDTLLRGVLFTVQTIGKGIGVVVEAWKTLSATQHMPEPTERTEKRIRERELEQTPWNHMLRWLKGLTHSPNVEIYEAKGMWARMRDWLMGTIASPPPVRIVEDQNSWSHAIANFLGIGKGGAQATGGNLAPGGRPMEGTATLKAVPNIAGMTGSERNFLALAEKYRVLWPQRHELYRRCDAHGPRLLADHQPELASPCAAPSHQCAGCDARLARGSGEGGARALA